MIAGEYFNIRYSIRGSSIKYLDRFTYLVSKSPYFANLSRKR